MIYLLGDLASELDWSGIYGGIFHYGMIIAFFLGALLAFLFFWWRGQLDMDEEPKLQMMRNDEEHYHE